MKFVPVFILLLLVEGIYSDSLSVLFLGDTYFGEAYQQDPKFNRDLNILEVRGYDSFFENVKGLLLGSNFAVANLETPLIDANDVPLSTIGNYVHYADTKTTPEFLTRYNIRAVTLANNHTMDLGSRGLISTVNTLSKSRISSFGAGDNEDEASKPYTAEFTSSGKIYRLYVLGCYWQREFFMKKGFYSGVSKSGVYMLDTVKLGKQIREIKAKDPDSFVVIYPHWGSNYKPANEIQKNAAHYLVDAGADLIIGHAAHTVQEAELYNGKWIFYNIGNFIFNAPGRYRSTKAKPYGLMIQLLLKEGGTTLKIYPVFTDNKKSDYNLRYLNEAEIKDCVNSLETESSAGKFKVSEQGYIEIQ